MSAAGGKPKRKKPRRQHSLISEHYDGVVEKMKIRRKGVPDYYYELNAEQKEINNMIMESMNRKVNFLKNPRFEGLGSPILYSDVSQKSNLGSCFLGEGKGVSVQGHTGGNFVRGLRNWADLFSEAYPCEC